MQPKRVVVTGMGGITAIGSDWDTVEKNLRAGITGVHRGGSIVLRRNRLF